jgi:uncharacterized heparinase superfamily protein
MSFLKREKWGLACMVSRWLRYFHTIRYLKATQIYFRLVKKVLKPRINSPVGKLSAVDGAWCTHELHDQKLFEDDRVVFLNREGHIACPGDWNNAEQPKLWLYNLHYFDDLSALGSKARADLHATLIARWINENPAPFGNGWEPYPTSLRICNWIKYFLSNAEPDSVVLNSIAQQADYLQQDLERHLLGNHLFVNAKALIFSGLYLDGKSAATLLSRGLALYQRELDEQVLIDGGNFELTPMYHVIMLVDLLDFVNIFTVFSHKIDMTVVIKTKKAVCKMITWLNVMSHDDGEISFFNDSCFGVAPTIERVISYANKLGFTGTDLPVLTSESIDLYDLPQSGYVSVKSKDYSLIADLAAIGPDYIPGHGHADALSFEFSLAGQRVFVNSGISEYGLGDERIRQRSTAAHNTITINGLDSSQVWSGFRVAKRASIQKRRVGGVTGGIATFGAQHNGFLKQGVNCVHERLWEVSHKHVKVADTLIGDYDIAVGYLHLHPAAVVVSLVDDVVVLNVGKYRVTVSSVGAKVSLEASTWHPQFGKSLCSSRLCFEVFSSSSSIELRWCIK